MSASNLAYDFSRFEDSAKRRESLQKPEKKPQIGVVKKTAPQTASPIKIVLCILAIAAVTSVIIYNQCVLTELGDKVNALTNKVAIAKSENVRKSAELDAKMSMKSIEEYAEEELGYVKLDQSKIEYVSLSEANKIEIAKPAKKGMFDRIKGFFSGILEYFK